MKISAEEMRAVSALSGADRYRYFIKHVAERTEAWGLFFDGWASAGDDGSEQAMPLWPAPEFAEACASREWNDFSARALPLEHLLARMLPRLAADGILVAVFFTPADNAVVVTAEKLAADLKLARQNYQ